ncbi:hypothetical protein CGRA01v4_10538 [Colletotrichum graminicola]|nr:hypothetical protein CGRA01v4_10538 [Colletotrichum graminicola]
MRRPDGKPDLEQTLPVPPVYRSEPHRRAAFLQDACTNDAHPTQRCGGPPPSSRLELLAQKKRHASHDTDPLFF